MSFIGAAINLLGLVGISAATLLAGLMLRDPFVPGWLKSEAVAVAAGLVLTAGAMMAIGFALAGLIAANIHYSVAVLVVSLVLAASPYVLWKAFNVGERLARADAGQSPFARIGKSETQAVLLLKPAT
jgi:hypothetical protein